MQWNVLFIWGNVRGESGHQLKGEISRLTLLVRNLASYSLIFVRSATAWHSKADPSHGAFGRKLECDKIPDRWDFTNFLFSKFDIVVLNFTIFCICKSNILNIYLQINDLWDYHLWDCELTQSKCLIKMPWF